jgi:hypothetical protein
VWPRPGRASYGSPRCLGCFCTLQWIHAQRCRSCVLPISLCFVSVASVHRSPSCSKVRPRRPSPCRLYPWRCATSHRVLTCWAKRSHGVPSGGLPSLSSPSCRRRMAVSLTPLHAARPGSFHAKRRPLPLLLAGIARGSAWCLPRSKARQQPRLRPCVSPPSSGGEFMPSFWLDFF